MTNWLHQEETDNDARAESDELSSCDNVQVVVRWYLEGVGYVTRYGPQQNIASTVSSSSIYDLLWSRHCGNATCSGQFG